MTIAYLIRAPGGPESLERAELPDEAVGPGQARVHHTAIGVNFLDTYYRSGLYGWPRTPLVPGCEAAGVVEEVADDVTSVVVGDRVAYTTSTGAYRTSRVLDASLLVALPAGVDDVTAAAVLLKGLTAQCLVTDSYRVRADDTVLVHAAAGGVGLLLGQWLADIGAVAIGTARGAEKIAAALEHGYAHMIDYGREDVVARVRELTGGKLCGAVFDSVGRDTWRASLQCLRTRGTFVSFGQSSGHIEGFSITDLSAGSFTAIRPKIYDFIATRAELEARASALFAMISDGRLRVDAITRRRFDDIVQVHRDLEGRRTVGSVVLMP